MTTIAYRDGEIAYDSRISEDDLILTDHANKVIEDNSYWFFYAGDLTAVQTMISGFNGFDVGDCVGEVEAIVWDGTDLWYAGITEGCPWKIKQLKSDYFAIGSGKPHALTAMDLGCTAEEAVKMAMMRDKNTGGKINTFRII